MDFFSGLPQDTAFHLQLELADPEYRRMQHGVGASSAENCSQAGDQLAEPERFRDVVIGAGLKR